MSDNKKQKPEGGPGKKSVKLTKGDIAHVADLIKIHLSEGELDDYKSRLETALDCANVFNELDTEGVKITSTSIGTKNIYREDEPVEGLGQDDALSNADAEDDGYFSVKRFIRKD